MKPKLIIAALIISLSVFTSCSNKEDIAVVYSFRGESDVITINNGIIISTGDMEKFVGGVIDFKGAALAGVKEYNTRFYYHKDNEEITIQSNYDSIQGSDEGMCVQPDLGSSSSKELFYGDNLDFIESLEFSITGVYVNEEKFEYRIPVNVTKIY